MNRIYLDNASTTALAPAVFQEMTPYFMECYGNASSVHGTGREAHRALDKARKRVAAALGAQPQEIYFTSGGSESDNWALKGAALANQNQGKHIITSVIEHHAVLNACYWLEGMGFEVTYLPVDRWGKVDPAAVEQAIRPDTILISLMTANNEIGTLQPIARVGEIARGKGILFHTDAVQAVGAVLLDVQALGVDLLSLSAHKFHGPKGIGALYIRRGAKVQSLIHGGSQERNLRAGTENLPAIVGLGKAIEMASQGIPERTARIAALRDQFILGVQQAIPEAILNGDPKDRLPGNIHFTFPGVDGEALLLRMDLMGIACSGGSACTSGSSEPSHVLAALGQGPLLSRGGLRITLSDQNTEAEMQEALQALIAIVRDLKS
ncbi:MAG: cysteine desulfurase [Clostridia bacterium]|nr:cysteine desulfurase [Clostridia bacterium]